MGIILRLWVAAQVKRLVQEQQGGVSIEWVGLGILVIAVLTAISIGLQSASGAGIATKLLNAFGRMFDRVP